MTPLETRTDRSNTVKLPPSIRVTVPPASSTICNNYKGNGNMRPMSDDDFDSDYRVYKFEKLIMLPRSADDKPLHMIFYEKAE